MGRESLGLGHRVQEGWPVINIKPDQFYVRADGKIVGNAVDSMPAVRFDDGRIDLVHCWIVDGGCYDLKTGEPLSKRWLPLVSEIQVCWVI